MWIIHARALPVLIAVYRPQKSSFRFRWPCVWAGPRRPFGALILKTISAASLSAAITWSGKTPTEAFFLVPMELKSI
jgi:hypothetical protein